MWLSDPVWAANRSQLPGGLVYIIFILLQVSLLDASLSLSLIFVCIGQLSCRRYTYLIRVDETNSEVEAAGREDHSN